LYGNTIGTGSQGGGQGSHTYSRWAFFKFLKFSQGRKRIKNIFFKQKLLKSTFTKILCIFCCSMAALDDFCIESYTSFLHSRCSSLKPAQGCLASLTHLTDVLLIHVSMWVIFNLQKTKVEARMTPVGCGSWCPLNQTRRKHVQ
jgi:hypothetical protein